MPVAFLGSLGGRCLEKEALITRKITIIGMVQGIGYRPYVARLSEELGIQGLVMNVNGIVEVLATATPSKIEQLIHNLKKRPPFGARIDRVCVEEQPMVSYQGFTIENSRKEDNEDGQAPLLPPDLPTCPTCEAQLKNPKDRRYGYPFISCVACGPRYSIITEIPYDRCNTTMDDFMMCRQCKEEYQARMDIRRHAQTISCHDCGPQLEMISLTYRGGEIQSKKVYRQDAYDAAAKLLLSGGIVAIKDIGGFHLACSPTNEQALKQLRRIKGREKKPFAVMFPNIEMIKKYCDISNQEQSLLEHISRPIVLLRKKEELFSTEVCKGSPDMGAMLPCNPLQILLCETCGPLVMTSGNRSGEPIITDNADMIQWMKEAVEIELGILMHERRILAPLDDSIMRIVAGKTQIFRRSRGFVPEPVTINKQFNRTVFATGGDLKSSFAFASGDRIYLSQYLGDIEDASVSKLYDAQRMRMEKLFGFVPEEVVTDLHPAYLSAKKAEMVRQEHEVMHPAYKIQHHHAHIASVIAEHGLSGKTLGIAFDGTGYGTDHTIWGSEFLLCEGTRFERVASLKPVKLIGGDEGAKNTDTILYGYLHSIGLGQEDGILKLQHIDMQKYKIVRAAIEHDINTVTSTSMGRLFDAVSALLNICHYNDYEGEAAIELENMAVKKCVSIPLKINLKRSKGRIVGCTDVLFKGLIDGMTQGVDKASLAAGFIEAVRRFIVDVCKRIDEPFDQIALSGGTFQNKLLLESVYAALTSDGYRVYINEQVPPGDGGISLGQAYLMASK